MRSAIPSSRCSLGEEALLPRVIRDERLVGGGILEVDEATVGTFLENPAVAGMRFGSLLAVVPFADRAASMFAIHALVASFGVQSWRRPPTTRRCAVSNARPDPRDRALRAALRGSRESGKDGRACRASSPGGGIFRG